MSDLFFDACEIILVYLGVFLFGLQLLDHVKRSTNSGFTKVDRLRVVELKITKNK